MCVYEYIYRCLLECATASGFQTSKKASEDDGDLNVDGDDSEEYGKPQYPFHKLLLYLIVFSIVFTLR